jgi:hypothetical protein
MTTVTQWFGPFSNPVHPGNYQSFPFEADDESIYRMAYWDGEDWLDRENGSSLKFQTRKWRGLVEKPQP